MIKQATCGSSVQIDEIWISDDVWWYLMIFDDIWIFHDTCLIFCLWEPTESNNEHPWVFPPRLSLGDVTRQIWNWMCNVLGSCRTLGIAKNRRHLKKSYKVKTPEPTPRGVQPYDTTLLNAYSAWFWLTWMRSVFCFFFPLSHPKKSKKSKKISRKNRNLNQPAGCLHELRASLGMVRMGNWVMDPLPASNTGLIISRFQHRMDLG